MQLVKVLCVALVGLTLVAAVAANVADSANEKAAVHDKCGAKGGHCEVASGCGGRKLKGLCDDNGSGAAAVCCLPGKKAKGKGLSPKQLAAKRKARAAEAKKQAKAAKAAGAAMAAQTAMAKALAKDVPAPSGKAVPAQPTAAEAAKAAKEGAAVAKAAAPQPPAAAKKLKAKKLKSKSKKLKAKAKGKKKAVKGKSSTKKLGMRVKKGSRGVDVAQKTNKKHWQCLKKAGWEWAVVRGFRSSNRPDPHAARSLKLAAKAGFGRRALGVYLYPCAKCGDAKGQVDRMVKHLKNRGAHRLFSTIWLDVEGRFWPAPKPTRKQRKQQAAALAAKRAAAVAAAKVNGNTGIVPPPALVKKQKQKKQKTSSRYGEARAFFRSLVRACRAHKRYRCGVYTSAQQWQSIMGKRPIRMAAKMPLWYPQFDVTPSAATDDFDGFSGWDNAWAKQYSENQNVCGLSADVNVRA